MAYNYAYKRTWKTRNAAYVYVDSWGGDDVLGAGTQDKPFQTINRAVLKPGSVIVLKGYFSEQVNATGRNYISDFLGDGVYDGKSIYGLNSSYIGYNQEKGIVVINDNNCYITNLHSCGIIINCFCNYFNGGYGNYVYDNVKLTSYGLFTNIIQERCAYLNITVNPRAIGNVLSKRSIYDGCKIYLDAAVATLPPTSIIDSCLFRANCTFWVRKPDNSADIRVDADGQTAAQKYAAIMNWFASGVIPSGYSKIPWVNCKMTDNRIFNKPDDEPDGYNYDYSLIYGDKEGYPACYMDSGKHIGPFPPAIKMAFKTTDALTSSPFEVEVKAADKLTISSGRLQLADGFSGAALLSKPMPIPVNTNFNGISLSVFPDTERNGVFVTEFDDVVDFSEAAKISLSAVGVALAEGKAYYIKSTNAYATYAGNTYQAGTVISAVDSATLCYLGGSGTATLHPVYRPTIYSGVKIKVAESAECPPDLLTNDLAYPWLDCKSSNTPGSGSSDEIGMRCLRVGNLISGAMDVGSDGRPLTSSHPEFYDTANLTRLKWLIRARWVVMKVIITKYN